MEDKSKQQLAEHRTDWAMERTLLAKQRTFSAWVRTGLTAMAVGFALVKLLGEVWPRWPVYLASALLVLAGIIIHLLAFWGYRGTFRKLQREGIRATPIWLIGIITGTLLFAASLVLVLIGLEFFQLQQT